jgi:hypothetical protein
MAFGTALRRVDPFQELMGIQDRMNQLFRSSFPGFGDDNLTSGAWAPAVDILTQRRDGRPARFGLLTNRS